MEWGSNPTPWSPNVQDVTSVNNKVTSSNASTFIADLAVNTLQIAGNAVTIPLVDRYGDSGTTNKTGNGTFQTVASVSITMPYAGWVYVSYFGAQYYAGSADSVTRLQINALTPTDTGGSAVQPVGVVADAVYLAAGTHTITVTWYGSSSNVTLKTRVLYVQGVMK